MIMEKWHSSQTHMFDLILQIKQIIQETALKQSN